MDYDRGLGKREIEDASCGRTVEDGKKVRESSWIAEGRRRWGWGRT